MKLRRKGFTLIELLAVIVILAIIMVVATPKILKVIEEAKKNSFEATARALVKAANFVFVKAGTKFDNTTDPTKSFPNTTIVSTR